MSRSPQSGGFTLVEVLVALTVLVVLLTGALSLLLAASGAIRAAGSSTRATMLALQKVEQLSANPSRSVGAVAQDYLAFDGTPATAGSETFVRRWMLGTAWRTGGEVPVVVEVFVKGEGRVARLETVVGGE